MEFRARVDTFVIGLTVFVLVLMGAVLTALLSALARGPESVWLSVALVMAAIAVLGIVVVAYVYTPTAFHIEATALRITRPVGDVVVTVESMTDVAALPGYPGLSLKVPPGGNSGLFGIYGTFWKRGLGKFQMYGRSVGGAVSIQSSSGRVVVTPERRDAFIRALRDRIAHHSQ